MYNQNYTELYQESVTGSPDKVWDDTAIMNARVYNVVDASNGRQANAWPNPADHYSVLRTFMGAASYIVGSHSLRVGGTFSNGDWKLLTRWTGDMQPITYNAGLPVSATLRLPSDRNNGINRDLGLYAQDRWSLGRVTLNLGLRFDQFVGETRESSVLASRHGAAATFGECSDGQVDPGDLCTGKVQNWKDLSPRVGFAMDVFGNGRTALKASYARYVAGQAIAFANQVNPIGALTAADTRSWTDRDGNGLPLDASGNIQFDELAASASTPTFGKLTVPTVQHDPALLNGWGKRGYNNEVTIAMQHQLADRVSVNGGYYRRTFGNQTIVDDLRYDASSYDSYCITAPSDPDLPDGGGYKVCGVMDLKPAVFALGLPAKSLIRFSDDFGGETNLYQGFDVNLESRFRNGAFFKAGIAATARTFDNCNTLAAGVDALAAGSAEVYADGTTGCHREYGYRPDAKMSGSYVALERPVGWHLPVHAGHPDRRRRAERAGLMGGDQRRRPAADWAQLDGRRIANGPADQRGQGLRQAQPEPGGPSPRQALRHARQGEVARGLRPLQRPEQQLAVYGQHGVFDLDHGCPVDAPDQRVAASLLQVRGEYQLLGHRNEDSRRLDTDG